MRTHGGFSIPRGARQILSIGSSPYKFTSMHHFDWEIGGPFNFETRPGYTPDGLRLIRISGHRLWTSKIIILLLFSHFSIIRIRIFFSSALSPFHFLSSGFTIFFIRIIPLFLSILWLSSFFNFLSSGFTFFHQVLSDSTLSFASLLCHQALHVSPRAVRLT